MHCHFQLVIVIISILSFWVASLHRSIKDIEQESSRTRVEIEECRAALARLERERTKALTTPQQILADAAKGIIHIDGTTVDILAEFAKNRREEEAK